MTQEKKYYKHIENITHKILESVELKSFKSPDDNIHYNLIFRTSNGCNTIVLNEEQKNKLKIIL